LNYLSHAYTASIFKIADAITTTKSSIQKVLPTNIEEASSIIYHKTSIKSYSDQITNDSIINFSTIMQRKIIKLHNRNQDFICKQPVFSLLCNNIIIQDPKIIIYKTSNNDLNLNCKVDAFTQEPSHSKHNKTIVCRHISYGYATEQFKLSEIDSKEKLQQHPFFQKDYEAYYCYYFPAEGYYFNSKQIGKVLQDIAKNLLITDIKSYKSYLLYTISHAMAIRITFKDNHWKIKVYDPNNTVTETIIIIENIGDFTLLDANDLNLSYYLRFEDALSFNSTDTKKNQYNCKVYVYDNNSILQILMQKRGHYHLTNNFNLPLESELILALVNNQSTKVNDILTNLKEYDITQLKSFTPSKNNDFAPAFNLCLIKGHVASIKVYLSFILSINICIKHKLFLVGNLVYLPIKFNQVATTVVYTKTIMASKKLSLEDKFNFIDSILLLELLYMNNHNENNALTAFIKIIQQSNFTTLQKQKLLPEN
jgi:hypothetical protein